MDLDGGGLNVGLYAVHDVTLLVHHCRQILSTWSVNFSEKPPPHVCSSSHENADTFKKTTYMGVKTFLLQIFFFLGGGNFFSYRIQHCIICRPSDSTVPTDAGIEPRTVATGALAIRRSNH
jgi:hypothetical protein